jgi:hypothetical protein
MKNPVKFTEHQKNLIARFNNAYNKCFDYELKHELECSILDMVRWHSGDGIIYYEFENEFHRKLNLLVFLGEIDTNQVIEKTEFLIYCRPYIVEYRKKYFKILKLIEQMNTPKKSAK